MDIYKRCTCYLVVNSNVYWVILFFVHTHRSIKLTNHNKQHQRINTSHKTIIACSITCSIVRLLARSITRSLDRSNVDWPLKNSNLGIIVYVTTLFSIRKNVLWSMSLCEQKRNLMLRCKNSGTERLATRFTCDQGQLLTPPTTTVTMCYSFLIRSERD